MHTSPVAPSSQDAITDSARVEAALALLEAIAADRSVLDALPEADRKRLHLAVARVHHPDPKANRRKLKQLQREAHAEKVKRTEALLDQTGIRTLRRKPVFSTPNYFPPHPPGGENVLEHAGAADESRVAGVPGAGDTLGASPEVLHCYVCKVKYTQVHHFYDQMCPACAQFNFQKRTETADLTGRVALLTGGRVKIGYQAGLKLLRAGCALIVTTRFPRDSAARYAEEPDFAEWGHRLEVFGLDLRHTPSVEAFCSHLLATRERLDFIINNACQTVRRPPEFYAHMMEGETGSIDDAPEAIRRLVGNYEGLRSHDLLPEAKRSVLQVGNDKALAGADGLTRAAELSQVPLLAEELLGQKHLFPEGRLDQDLQQSTCATAIPGACSWPKCLRWSCLKCSW